MCRSRAARRSWLSTSPAVLSKSVTSALKTNQKTLILFSVRISDRSSLSRQVGYLGVEVSRGAPFLVVNASDILDENGLPPGAPGFSGGQVLRLSRCFSALRFVGATREGGRQPERDIVRWSERQNERQHERKSERQRGREREICFLPGPPGFSATTDTPALYFAFNCSLSPSLSLPRAPGFSSGQVPTPQCTLPK